VSELVDSNAKLAELLAVHLTPRLAEIGFRLRRREKPLWTSDEWSTAIWLHRSWSTFDEFAGNGFTLEFQHLVGKALPPNNNGNIFRLGDLLLPDEIERIHSRGRELLKRAGQPSDEYLRVQYPNPEYRALYLKHLAHPVLLESDPRVKYRLVDEVVEWCEWLMPYIRVAVERCVASPPNLPYGRRYPW
jgi:hypothetical protein